MVSSTAQEYVNGVRALLSAEPLADRAEELAPISDVLTADLSRRLYSGEPVDRAATETHLLAKAMVDLEVSALLKRAAEDEGAPTPKAALADRAVFNLQVEPYLKVLLGEEPETISERAIVATDLRSARDQLPTFALDTMQLIASRASGVAKQAFTKLAALGFAQVLHAAGIVGQGLAQSLGIDETLGRLYRLCRDFALKVFNALVTLIGDALAKIVGDKVSAWIKEHTNEDHFSSWLQRQYAIEAAGTALAADIAASQAALPAFQNAAKGLQDLSDKFGGQMEIAGKLIKGTDYLRLIPVSSTPQGVALFAAAYLLICGYAVFAGGDFLDSSSLDLLHRVDGVPTVVHQMLA
jgi:hypothetical protein